MKKKAFEENFSNNLNWKEINISPFYVARTLNFKVFNVSLSIDMWRVNNLKKKFSYSGNVRVYNNI
jgi:hypothetical protein